MAKNYTVQDIVAEIDAKQFSPIYFLMGDEPYFIDWLTDYMLSHILTPEQQDFDQLVMYGKDLDSAARVVTAARQYPMASPWQVIAVKEAQSVSDLEDVLARYMQQPMPTTVLIVNYKGKTLDKRRKLAAELQKSGVVFESKKLYDSQVPAWIRSCAAQKGLEVDEKACQMLADFLGTDLGRIVTELDKLRIVLGGPGKVTPALVERNIGISKDFNNFELIDALRRRDALKAHQIARYFAANPKDHPLVLTNITLFDFFSKLLLYIYLVDKSPMNVASKLGVPPSRVRDYEMAAANYKPMKVFNNLSLVREFDAKSKGFGQSATDDGELLKELLCRLMA